MGAPSDSTADDDRRQLAARAEAAEAATWSSGDEGPGPMPGLLAGEVGPKGHAGARLRELSRTERASWGDVPRGTTSPGTGRYVLGAMLCVAVVLLLAAALIGWLAS